MKSVDSIIEEVIGAEGGYTDNPKDKGGPTRWGITEAVARAAGYTGPMKDLPRQTAKAIYLRQYVDGPNFDDVLNLSPAIAAELVDTGVNMGTDVSCRFLQQCLNAFNQEGKLFADLKVDGNLGLVSIAALQTFLKTRGAEGEAVMLKALNCLQGARYITITEARPANEAFVYGWIKNRVGIG